MAKPKPSDEELKITLDRLWHLNSEWTDIVSAAIAADRKRIEELESEVAFWDRANERQYDKWIQLSRFWQKAENKPNTLPDRMKLLEWLIQHIQEGVESFLNQTATIERLRGAINGLLEEPTIKQGIQECIRRAFDPVNKNEEYQRECQSVEDAYNKAQQAIGKEE